MHIHKIEFDFGSFGFGIGWHCVKCGKVYKNKPKLIILINKILNIANWGARIFKNSKKKFIKKRGNNMYKVELTERELILLCNLVSQENKKVRAEFKLKNINFDKFAANFEEAHAYITTFDKFKNLAIDANLSIRGLTKKGE